MKYCPNCGSQNDDTSLFCLNCGQPLSTPVNDIPNYQQHQNYQSNMYQENIPMGWYKFLIYFSLFASAALNIISGISSITGLNYGEFNQLIYAYYGGLKTVDIIMGFFSIALGVVSIIVRQNLAHYKKGAPLSLIGLYIASLVISVIYVIAVSLVTNLSITAFLSTAIIINFIVSIIMTCVNYVYFKNRRHLFTE